MPFRAIQKEWIAEYLCQEDVSGGSYTTLSWLHDRSRLRRSCLPCNVSLVDNLSFFCQVIVINNENVQ